MISQLEPTYYETRMEREACLALTLVIMRDVE